MSLDGVGKAIGTLNLGVDTASRRLGAHGTRIGLLETSRAAVSAARWTTIEEATKGLAQRIRDMSGIQADGAALVDRVFSIERPVLAINSLQTETEKSEHKGFASLLKGCFAAARNPLAHEPKVLWQGEDDAADYLSLISLLHRKLDDSVRTGLREI